MERVPVSLSLIYLVSLATSQREYEFEQSSSKPRTENRKRRAKNPSLGGTSSKLHALQKDNPKYFVFIPPLSSSSSYSLTRNSKFFQRFRSNSRLVSPRFNRIVIVCLCIRKGVVSTRPVTISLCVRIADAVRYVYIHYIRIFEHSLLHLPRLRLPRIIRLYIVCTILSSSISRLLFFFHFIVIIYLEIFSRSTLIGYISLLHPFPSFSFEHHPKARRRPADRAARGFSLLLLLLRLLHGD